MQAICNDFSGLSSMSREYRGRPLEYWFTTDKKSPHRLFWSPASYNSKENRTSKDSRRRRIKAIGTNQIIFVPYYQRDKQIGYARSKKTKNSRRERVKSIGENKPIIQWTSPIFPIFPCITLRKETEWVETVKSGWNILVGTNKEKIIKNVKYFEPEKLQYKYFGDGKTAKKIIKILGSSPD